MSFGTVFATNFEFQFPEVVQHIKWLAGSRHRCAVRQRLMTFLFSRSYPNIVS